MRDDHEDPFGRIVVFFFNGLLLDGAVQGKSLPVHTRTETFGPMRLSYPDLLATIKRIRNLIATANGPVIDKELVDESLRLNDGGLGIQLEGDFSIENLHGAPEVASEIWYSYRRRGASVSDIELRLGDVVREINVTGISREQVDAVVGLVVTDSE